MSHRLRRIIGVNIRTPRADGAATSLRFSELDTRGAVMAVGPNGVGKTSFLRLIPLFYGALPSRILRGSGHTRMIRYMLPHASSAVVFEYERESENDVRCAVMHASSDEAVDAPHFHIISATFEERFLSDDQGNFLNRDEFKSHVEGLGIEVSQQLTHADYRSVILNNVGSTKNALKLRRLTAQHSFGPGNLSGLDEIAAAMGPEAMSFQAMQQIVVDQITAEMSTERKTDRRLLKNAEDVTRWLDGHEHLSRLQARGPDADQLTEKAKEIQRMDEILRDLRKATTDLILSEKEVASQATSRLGRLQEDGAKLQQEYAQNLDAANNRVKLARSTLKELELRQEQTVSRRDRYATLGVEALHEEMLQEQSIQGSRRRLEAELRELEKEAQGITRDFSERAMTIERHLSGEKTQLANQQAKVASDQNEQTEKIQSQLGAAIELVVAPERLKVIPEEISSADQLLGKLQAQVGNPSATPETLERLSQTEDLALQADQALDDARDSERNALQAHRTEERSRDFVLASSEAMERELAEINESAQELGSRLMPPEGSLLAFIRNSNATDRAVIAKAINPELLPRTDLHPVENYEGVLHQDGAEIGVGSLTLNVTDVSEPDWLELPNVRTLLETVNAKRTELLEISETAANSLRSANQRVDVAANLVTQKAAHVGARKDDVDRLRAQIRQLQNDRNDEIKSARARYESQTLDAQSDRAALIDEKEKLERSHNAAVNAVTKAYQDRVTELQRQSKSSRERLQAELAIAEERAANQLVALRSEEEDKLAEANVDVNKLQMMREEIAGLSKRLESVADNRDEVLAWLRFRGGDLLELPGLVVKIEQGISELGRLQGVATQIEIAKQDHADQVRVELESNQSYKRTAEANVQQLESLLLQQLASIGVPRLSAAIVQTWTTEALLQEVVQRRKELAQVASRADELVNAIRGEMRAGKFQGVSDWLQRQEQELAPDLENLPEHLVTLKRARMICQWHLSAAADVVHSHNADLSAVLAAAGDFVSYLDVFDRLVIKVNTQLQAELTKVKPFPSFRDLAVDIRSRVKELDYMAALRQMKDRADSSVALHRISAARGRDTALADRDTVALMRQFRELLARDKGIAANLSELVRLECELTINGKRIRIENADSFKTHASNGNTGMIFAMFLMGFAGMVRRNARVPVRLSWIVDELGRFDGPNLQLFLQTLDENSIDVISARPEADPTTLDLFDSEARFGMNGRISSTRLSVDNWEAIDVTA